MVAGRDIPRQRRKDALDREIKACRKCTSPEHLNVPGVTVRHQGSGHCTHPWRSSGRPCAESAWRRGALRRWQRRILEEAFKSAGVAKAELFITNSIHCHPPGDRDPYPHETWNCSGFLRAELREIVQPRLVIGVGEFAKAAVRSLYESDARELNWPFRVPRPRLSDSTDTTYLIFPKHPYWIMTRPERDREQYIRRLARAMELGGAPPHQLRPTDDANPSTCLGSPAGPGSSPTSTRPGPAEAGMRGLGHNDRWPIPGRPAAASIHAPGGL